MERPQTIHRSFGHFVRAHNIAGIEGYPCLECRGIGTWRQASQDEYEEHTSRCGACGGSGQGTREECLQAYRGYVESLKQERQRVEELSRLKMSAFAKLTGQEIEALYLLGVQ